MKKTDRDKDWPMVEALSQQAALGNDANALLHTRDTSLLARLWAKMSAGEKSAMIARRPLLGELEQPRHGLRRCLAAERALWEKSNRLRYRSYQHEWKNFLRRWHAHDDFVWPVSLQFPQQHQLVCEAARIHHLPVDPLGGVDGRRNILMTGASAVTEIFDPAGELLKAITPPLSEILP